MSIRADIFPAIISLTQADSPLALSDLRSAPPSEGGIQINTARLIITGNRLIIGKDTGTGPQIVYSQEIDPDTYFANPSQRDDSYVVALNGTKIAFKKDDQCGCGSRLKSWNPYKSIMGSSKDPTE